MSENFSRFVIMPGSDIIYKLVTLLFRENFPLMHNLHAKVLKNFKIRDFEIWVLRYFFYDSPILCQCSLKIPGKSLTNTSICILHMSALLKKEEKKIVKQQNMP